MYTIKNFLEKYANLFPLIAALKEAGATSYLVGGGVRDLVLGLPVKDIDIEVHKISLEELEKVLKKFGPVSLIGKQFGVLKLHYLDIDWSLPRTDSTGRKPEVAIDPFLGIEQALRRRDITMNAMAIDLNELIEAKIEISEITIIDPYGGLKDIAQKTIRSVDEKLFLEDPLRFYRVMQFIGRFEMYPDEALNNLCKRMELADSLTHEPIAKERVYEELKKLCLKAKRPSLGIRWLYEIGRLNETFPELAALVGVKQRADYHPEGDAFEHTMQALDASAELDVDKEKWVLMLATLCHDMGKAVSTFVGDDGIIHAWDHEESGVPIAVHFLKRITNDISISESVKKLVRYHLMPGQLVSQGAHLKAYKHLAYKLAPQASLWQLGLVARSDLRGRNPHSHEPLPSNLPELETLFASYEECITKAQVSHAPEEPVLKGRHLLEVMSPGPQMGKLLDEAYHIQIEEGIKDLDALKNRVLKK